MGARWYDPTIGLWTQPDTLVPNPLDPLALNRYRFVEGNPLRYRDPSGYAVALPADIRPASTVIDVAPTLNVNQAQVTIEAESPPTTLVTTEGPAIEPCRVYIAPPSDSQAAVQIAPPDSAPRLSAASDSSAADQRSESLRVSTPRLGTRPSMILLDSEVNYTCPPLTIKLARTMSWPGWTSEGAASMVSTAAARTIPD